MSEHHVSSQITCSEEGYRRISEWLDTYRHVTLLTDAPITTAEVVTSGSHAIMLSGILFEPLSLVTFTRLSYVTRDKEAIITITGHEGDVAAAARYLNLAIATADHVWREAQLSAEFEFFDSLQVLARRKPVYKDTFYGLREQLTALSYNRLVRMSPMQRHLAAQRRRAICAL